MGRLFVGVEIGGSKLQAAVGSGDGQLQAIERRSVVPEQGRDGVLAALVELIPAVLGHFPTGEIAGIGIGFGGPVLTGKGMTVRSHQVKGWDSFPIVEWFEEQFKLPSAVGNDSDLAGWAEASVGAGVGYSPVVYMNVGSGIGGAIIIDNKLYEGQGVGAGEIGHMRMERANNGQWLTLEDLASGWALDAEARKCFPEKRDATARDLIAAAQRGNALAVSAWSNSVERWGVAIANVITLLCPQRFVLGGGVALTGDFFLKAVRDEVQKHVFSAFVNRYEIVLAKLGEEMVVHGAIALARDRL